MRETRSHNAPPTPKDLTARPQSGSPPRAEKTLLEPQPRTPLIVQSTGSRPCRTPSPRKLDPNFAYQGPSDNLNRALEIPARHGPEPPPKVSQPRPPLPQAQSPSRSPQGSARSSTTAAQAAGPSQTSTNLPARTPTRPSQTPHPLTGNVNVSVHLDAWEVCTESTSTKVYYACPSISGYTPVTLPKSTTPVPVPRVIASARAAPKSANRSTRPPTVRDLTLEEYEQDSDDEVILHVCQEVSDLRNYVLSHDGFAESRDET